MSGSTPVELEAPQALQAFSQERLDKWSARFLSSGREALLKEFVSVTKCDQTDALSFFIFLETRGVATVWGDAYDLGSETFMTTYRLKAGLPPLPLTAELEDESATIVVDDPKQLAYEIRVVMKRSVRLIGGKAA